MKSYTCQSCGQLVFFENVQCVSCGHALGYLPVRDVMSALEAIDEERWRPLAPAAADRLYRMCVNYRREQVCNWMVADDEKEPFCLACRLNQTIPDLSRPENRTCWQRLEQAKRRLVYSLLRLGLPVVNKQEDPEQGLAFAFLADPEPHFREGETVKTGHVQGLITLNIAEADDVVREQMRLRMNEVYRTLLGHFRHESGHYYWDRLIYPNPQLEAFRQRFGDERAEYDQALQRHYEQGPPSDWQAHFVSVYASAHPWEDWAETWAHYLHIVDALETACSFGLRVKIPNEPVATEADATQNTYRPRDFDRMLEQWFPITYAINSLNRSMGQPDMYPFVLSASAIDKLRFVHDIIGRRERCF